MFYIVGAVISIAVFILGLKLKLFFYEHQGSAQPDDPNQKDFPIIKGPGDATAQKIIDRAKEPKK
jgi:hypothetical protein